MSDISTVLGESVSRETLDKLSHYLDLLKKWTAKINLVSPSTINAAWDRHFLDSAQVYRFRRSDAKIWVDLGSGAGFPGLVCSVLASELNPEIRFVMVESDGRKSAFLRTVIRELQLNAEVRTARIEALDSVSADIVSARALASLRNLIPMQIKHGQAGAQGLFLKGENWQKEVADAQEAWSFSVTPHVSTTDPNAVILEIGDILNV